MEQVRYLMIFYVEDDESIRELMLYTLKAAGFNGKGFSDSVEFWQAISDIENNKMEKPDLIMLDIMLPGEEGIAILKKLKNNTETENIPVIIASAKGTEYDKIIGLDLGADDYLAKPFGMMEMISRIKAVLRRYPQKENNNILQYGGITLNTDEHTAYAGKCKIELSLKEFELLKLFMENPEHLFEREHIILKVWGDEFIGESRTLDMHISKLRKKLGVHGNMIKNIRSLGYRMEKE